MTSLILTFLLAGSLQASPAAPPLIRVFVHTDETGYGPELQGRKDSVRDLRDALEQKKKTVSVVAEQEMADVTIEVVDRTATIPKIFVGGVTSVNRPPGTPPPGPAKVVHLRVKLAYGTEFLPLENKNQPIESSGGWRSAADDIAKQVDKWLADHRQLVLKGRGGVVNPLQLH